MEARGLYKDHYGVHKEVLALGLYRLVAYLNLITKVKMRKLDHNLAAFRLRQVPLVLAKM